eukprot:scaffold8327_cov106-Isochrysis_galbana.AAC.2
MRSRRHVTFTPRPIVLLPVQTLLGLRQTRSPPHRAQAGRPLPRALSLGPLHICQQLPDLVCVVAVFSALGPHLLLHLLRRHLAAPRPDGRHQLGPIERQLDHREGGRLADHDRTLRVWGGGVPRCDRAHNPQRRQTVLAGGLAVAAHRGLKDSILGHGLPVRHREREEQPVVPPLLLEQPAAQDHLEPAPDAILDD